MLLKIELVKISILLATNLYKSFANPNLQPAELPLCTPVS